MAIGLVIYLGYGLRQSTLGKQLRGLIPGFAGGQPLPADKVPGPVEGIKRPDTDITGKG
jgi:hypothetical protein